MAKFHTMCFLSFLLISNCVYEILGQNGDPKVLDFLQKMEDLTGIASVSTYKSAVKQAAITAIAQYGRSYDPNTENAQSIYDAINSYLNSFPEAEPANIPGNEILDNVKMFMEFHAMVPSTPSR